MNYKALGQRVRALRKKEHLTQTETAKQLDISMSFLGHIERGTRILSLETLVRIAAQFGVTLDYLVFGEQSEAEPATERDRRLSDVTRVLDRHYDEWGE